MHAPCICEECREGPGIDYRARDALVQANREQRTVAEFEALVRKDPRELTAGERDYLRNVFSD